MQADDGGAQVGGMLAAMLDYPFASLVTSIEVLEGGKLKIGREIEGGSKEINAIDLPCVLSIQTGINEPRYVGMRGIRQVASVPIPDARRGGAWPRCRHGRRSRREGEARWITSCRPRARAPRCSQGSREEVVDKLMDLLKAKGGLN